MEKSRNTGLDKTGGSRVSNNNSQLRGSNERTTGARGTGGARARQTGGTNRTSGAPAGSTIGARRSMMGTGRTGQPRGSRMATGLDKKGRGTGEKDGAAAVTVFDDAGNDVTPKPLLSIKPSVLKDGSQSHVHLGKSGETSPQGSEAGTQDLDRMSQSAFSIRGMSYTESGTPGSNSPGSVGTAMSSPRGEEETAKDEEKEKEKAAKTPKKTGVVVGKEEDDKGALTDAELDRNVYITLRETDTFWLLNILGQCVANESPEAPTVEAANERYRAMTKAREGSELFSEMGTQTLDTLKKCKEVQTMPKLIANSDCQVTVWDIVDSMEEEEAGEEMEGQIPSAKAQAALSSGAQRRAAMELSAVELAASLDSLQAPANPSESSKGGGAAAAPPAEAVGSEAGKDASKEPEVSLDNLDNLASVLTIMERAVTQNIYHDRLLHYRDFRPRPVQPVAVQEGGEGEEGEEGTEGGGEGIMEDPLAPPQAAAAAPEAPPPVQAPAAVIPGVPTPMGVPEGETKALHHLWDFKCALTEGRNVSCVACNQLRKDMLVVGYGQFEFSKQKEGMVAFWSLKNPEYPDWTFKSPTGVTALAFSKHQPSLLAVGFYDGMVAIYDVRAATEKPTLESGHSSGKHSDPVWKLQWVERGAEGGENLISISTDGRVTQWSIKKGLEHTDLMKLKRVHRRTIPKEAIEQHQSTQVVKPGQPPPPAINTKTEAFISRRSSGMCFDFNPKDPNIYLVGTEDGNIHKCSCSYSEQYLESYFGHSGPLYQIQWSPYASNLFLSASADWTVKLWSEDSESAIITFQSGTEEVADLQWSPSNSTVIGTASCDGRLEIWDVSQTTQEPILTHTLQDTKLSCILFLEASPIVLCGGNNGAVSVFRLVGVEHPDTSFDEERQRLEDAMSSNIVSSTEEDKGAAK